MNCTTGDNKASNKLRAAVRFSIN